MSFVYFTNGKIIFNKAGDVSNLPCPTGCCGREPPGICCSGIWHDTPPECGVCCYGENAPNGIWVPSDLPLSSGICCGGEWYPPEVEGDCCLDVWYPKNAGCPEGQIFLTWGQFNECCGCVNEEDAPLKDQFCCPVCTGGQLLPGPGGCLYRCCDSDCGCQNTLLSDCTGQWYANSCCETLGCPQPCCVEDEDCNVICNENIPIGQCVSSTDCATGEETIRTPGECGKLCSETCLGACCENGVYIDQTTQEECAGCWSGPGSTVCVGECLDSNSKCCEKKTSKGAGLTFSKPLPLWNRCKNCSELLPETLRVTVTGTTDSPILIHGTPFGDDGIRCSINYSFLICWEKFNIEPVPCDTNFRYLDVTVCWETEATDTEVLDFSGCNDIGAEGAVWLGACDYGCVTTLTYYNSGHTSDVNIQLYGNSIIEANGTGPLVLTSPITVNNNSCVDTLIITGISTANNTIEGPISPFPSNLSLIKKGIGTWRLGKLGNAPNNFGGQVKVLDGTLVALVSATDVVSNGSLFGSGLQDPLIGDTEDDVGGTAILLIAKDVNIDRSVTVTSLGNNSSQEVIIGMTGAPGLAILGGDDNFSKGKSLRLGRDVTLQAENNGTLMFKGTFKDINSGPNPAVQINIGSANNNGIVDIEQSFFPDSITGINIRYGILKINSPDPFDPNAYCIGIATPVTIGSNLGSGTLLINGFNQPLESITFSGSNSEIIEDNNGALILLNNPTVSILTQSNEISCNVELDDTVTFDGSGELLISGIISENGGIDKNGSGIVTLSGANTYSGITTINDGTMKAENITAFGSGDIVVNAGGTLDKNGYALANNIINNGGTILN